MRKSLLKGIRENLEGMKRQLLAEIERSVREGREATPVGEGMDAYDVATEERDREISFLMNERDRAKLQAINEALERMTAGTYGVCEACEGEIAPERLRALPFTRVCVTCQAEREKEAKLTRRVEEQRVFRRFGTSDVGDENT